MMPIIYIVIFVVVILLLCKQFCRLTVVRCYSPQHMTGKTVLVTGATSGIGKETAMDMARRNARVLLACRYLERNLAEKVKSDIMSITGNSNVEIKYLELESFESVRKCAEDVLKTESRLDVLINNAGVAHGEVKLTEDGCERTMQVNHLGHFLLTLLLLDLLKKSQPSRIINVSSINYMVAALDMDDMTGSKQSLFLRNFGNLYNRSKLANIWFTTELARRLAGTGVTVNVLHPGMTKTNIFYSFEHPLISIFRIVVLFFGKTAEEGAQTSIYLAVDPDVEKITGNFFYDCREHMLFGQAKDKVKARKFFELSENIVGTTYKD